MLIYEIVMVALAAIRANVLRSVLTTLGIVIGVAAVITMVSLGEGAQQRVQAQIQRMGTNVLTIRPGQEFMGGVGRGETRMSVEDAEALRSNSGGLILVAPELQSRLQVAYARWNASTTILGTWPEYFAMYNHALTVGRFFNQGEVQGRRRVAVVGANIPKTLGQEADPAALLGQTIQIRGVPFEVIGIMAVKGDAAFMRPDDQVFIPQSTAQYRVFGGRDRIGSIYASTATPEQLDQAYTLIDRIMRRQHRIEPGGEADFSVRNSTDLLETFNETAQTFTMLLAGIAGISLLVGGIGIMNIMLVSVTERTREIGVRKALGATRRAIMFQFLIESLFLCVLGGLMGVGAGIGGAALITRLQQWETVVSPGAILMALAFSAGVGLFFGIWPAQRAAKLDPIVALRYE